MDALTPLRPRMLSVTAPRPAAAGPVDSVALSAPRDTGARDRAMASFVQESNSAEGRQMKKDALLRVLAVKPDLSAEDVHALAGLVNESNSLEGRRLKLRGVTRLFELKPDLDAAGVRAVARAVNASETLEGRGAKLAGFATVLQAQPAVGADFLGALADFANGSNSTEGYSLKFRTVAAWLAVQPNLTPEFLRATASMVDESTGVEGKQLKLDRLGKMLAQKPDLTPDLVRATAALVNESNSLEGRRLKLDATVEYLQAVPTLTSAQLRAVAGCVNESNSLEGRALKLGGFRQVLQLQPQASPNLLEALGGLVNSVGGLDARRRRMALVVGLVRQYPDLTSEEVRRLRDTASPSLLASDRQARQELALQDLQLSRAEAALPSPSGASKGGLFADADKEPEMVAARRGVELCREAETNFQRALNSPRSGLFGAEPDLLQTLWEPEAGRINEMAKLGGAGAALAGMVASLFLPGPFKAVGGLASLLLGGRYGSKAVVKLMQPRAEARVEEKMRAIVQDARDGWTARRVASEARMERVRAGVIERLARSAPAPVQGPAPDISEDLDSVVIGGIRLDRRGTPTLDREGSTGPAD